MTWTHAASLDEAHAARPWLARSVRGVDFVIAMVDGAPYAVENRCSHADCAFSEDGELDDTDVICNCHGSEFDIRTGEVRRGPAVHPIRTFPVRLAGDQVEVDL